MPLVPQSSPVVSAALARDIDAKLANTPMRGQGKSFVASANRYGINPWFLVSVAGAESQFGKTGFATNGSHNPFGLGVTGAPGAGFRFATWPMAIEAAAKNLSGPTYSGKDSISAIGSKWAADPKWAEKVAKVYSDLTGSRVLDTEVVKGTGRGTVQPDPNTTPLDVLDKVNPVGALVDLFKLLLDPDLWIRIGEMVLGVIAMVGGGAVLFRMSGVAGKPLGLFIMAFGFMWLYSGVKGVSPVDSLKAFVGA
jgi:hypothetical protein